MKKFLLLSSIVALCCFGVSCGDDDDPVVPEPTPTPTPTPEPEPEPEPEPQPEPEPEPAGPTITPNSFAPLKTYIDRAAHPIFKLSGAIEAWDFNSQAKLRDTLSLHFDEIVAGNSMKYSGCVDGSGNMNFNTVKDFCAKAKAAGLTIYGHTLAWHSQQQPDYLMGLMKKEVAEDPEPGVVETETSLFNVDFTTFKGTAKHVISDNEGTVKDGYDNSYNPGDNVDYPYYAMGYVPTMTDEGLESKSSGWYQYFVCSKISVPVDENADYRVKMSVKADGNLSFKCVARWSWSEDPITFDVKFTKSSDFKDYAFDFSGIKGDGFELIFQPSAGTDFVIKNLEIFKVEGKAKHYTVELTAEEKRDTLIWAMDHWIQGIMEATDGFVKAWDVVNEALSGGDKDGDGIYDLQSYELNNNGDPTNVSAGVFYWQYFMGDLEYMRTAVASARKHFKGNPDELKLFVNDYNLESDWDDNGKLKSLIKWIEKWEADGVTYIDGIGTQMHITCYENANLQKSCEDHIVKMFQLMAKSGKLCRISELDMGYKRGSNRWGGSNLTTSQLTEKEHQKMADYYKFIIQKYFEIIPPEQQYGICQWCLTDAPSNSGWRANEPVGIWSLNYKKRKQVYQGWAEALGANLE